MPISISPHISPKSSPQTSPETTPPPEGVDSCTCNKIKLVVHRHLFTPEERGFDMTPDR